MQTIADQQRIKSDEFFRQQGKQQSRMEQKINGIFHSTNSVITEMQNQIQVQMEQKQQEIKELKEKNAEQESA